MALYLAFARSRCLAKYSRQCCDSMYLLGLAPTSKCQTKSLIRSAFSYSSLFTLKPVLFLINLLWAVVLWYLTYWSKVGNIWYSLTFRFLCGVVIKGFQMQAQQWNQLLGLLLSPGRATRLVVFYLDLEDTDDLLESHVRLGRVNIGVNRRETVSLKPYG